MHFRNNRTSRLSESAPARRRPAAGFPVLAAAASIALALAALSTAAASPPPRLLGGHLLVDGRPFLIRGGEIGNSSATNPDYL
ncbi:MAG: hypothetical protein ACREFX_01460, partial [Opitutaceae bacterium]